MSFCHTDIIPGPEALQLAIYVGYRSGELLAGGVLAGARFIVSRA